MDILTCLELVLPSPPPGFFFSRGFFFPFFGGCADPHGAAPWGLAQPTHLQCSPHATPASKHSQ